MTAREAHADESATAGAVRSLERPHENLFKYYVAFSFLAGPFFPLLLLPLYFRFRTLRYRFDDEGVSMRWGILFRKEISLTYTRIQDIHLASNAIERYLGLARVQVQTASGTSKAEMTIEGLREYEPIRDYLYARMRGVRSGTSSGDGRAPGRDAAAGDPGDLATALHAVASEIAELRRDLAARATSGPVAEKVEP